MPTDVYPSASYKGENPETYVHLYFSLFSEPDIVVCFAASGLLSYCSTLVASNIVQGVGFFPGREFWGSEASDGEALK